MIYIAPTLVKDDLNTKMEPPRSIGEKTNLPRKNRNRDLAVEPEIEETLGASSSEPRFPREYILPRKDDSASITLHKTSYYMLVIPYIS
jgi:hypothetical protein